MRESGIEGSHSRYFFRNRQRVGGSCEKTWGNSRPPAKSTKLGFRTMTLGRFSR